MVVLSTELLLCLTTPVWHFQNFTMNITIYLETHRVVQKLTEYGKLCFDWSIQRSLGRPTQNNLVRCSYIEINISILIRLRSRQVFVSLHYMDFRDTEPIYIIGENKKYVI